MEGPKIELRISCFDCKYCRSERYRMQGDSGQDVYCDKMEGKRIGDTNWNTPKWCPFYPSKTLEALARKVEK